MSQTDKEYKVWYWDSKNEVVVDDPSDDAEFQQECQKCQAETVLADFSIDNSGKPKYLCEFCANTLFANETHERDIYQIQLHVNNMMSVMYNKLSRMIQGHE